MDKTLHDDLGQRRDTVEPDAEPGGGIALTFQLIAAGSDDRPFLELCLIPGDQRRVIGQGQHHASRHCRRLGVVWQAGGVGIASFDDAGVLIAGARPPGDVVAFGATISHPLQGGIDCHR